ncbi:hypothetical protein GCM10019017_47430 [Streptomyces showdoensis]
MVGSWVCGVGGRVWWGGGVGCVGWEKKGSCGGWLGLKGGEPEKESEEFNNNREHTSIHMKRRMRHPPPRIPKSPYH